jgi:hypothetical protein
MQNHIIASSAQAFAQADAPKRSEAEWAEIIREDLGHAVEGIIAAGEHLRQAKYQLAHGRFLPLLKSIGLHERTAERLMKIAANVVLANPTHGSKLPTSMRTLYELSTLPVKLLEARISDGTITPDIERRDVEQLKHKRSSDDKVEVDGKTVKHKPTLTEKLKAAEAEVRTLKERLERKGDGSLFDLKLDSAEEIGKTLADNMSEQRFDIAVKAAKARYKAKRQKPAG